MFVFPPCDAPERTIRYRLNTGASNLTFFKLQVNKTPDFSGSQRGDYVISCRLVVDTNI